MKAKAILHFLVILCCTSICLHAQSIKVVFNDPAYNEFYYRCSRDYGYELKDSLPDGHYEVWFKTDSLTYKLQEAYYEGNSKNGIWQTYFPSGKIQETKTYIKGIKHGKLIRYYENGNIEYEGYYREGIMDGLWLWYNKDHSLRSKNTFNNFSKIGIEISYFANGQIKSIENFDDGVFHGGCFYFYENGLLQRETYFFKDKAIGTWKYYSEIGELIRKVEN